MAASFVAACMDVLSPSSAAPSRSSATRPLAIVGGVAASPILRARAQALADEFGTRLLIPPQRHGDRQRGHDRCGRLAEARSVSGPSAPSFGPEPDLRLHFA